jgi:hypothetical protein
MMCLTKPLAVIATRCAARIHRNTFATYSTLCAPLASLPCCRNTNRMLVLGEALGIQSTGLVWRANDIVPRCHLYIPLLPRNTNIDITGSQGL